MDDARRDITTIQTYQLQARQLQPLQDDLQRALLEDGCFQIASVGLSFGSQAYDPTGARLVVRYVLLLELKKDLRPASRPAEASSRPSEPPDRPQVADAVRTLARNALSRCGWEVEDLYTNDYEQRWCVRGTIRGAGKPASAGAGLDLLPERRP